MSGSWAGWAESWAVRPVYYYDGPWSAKMRRRLKRRRALHLAQTVALFRGTARLGRRWAPALEALPTPPTRSR